MNALEVLKNQTTCREYSEKKITDDTLLNIINVAKQSPSWKNGQAYHIIVTDGEVKNKICDLFNGKNGHIKTCSHFLIFLADLSKAKTIVDYKKEQIAGFDIYDTLVATTDAAIVAQSVNIAAQAQGVQTCYIGLLRNVENELKEILNLPEYSYVVFGLTLGYPEESYKKRIKPRLDNSINVSWNKYETKITEEKVKEYDKKMDDFNAGKSYIWSDINLYSYIKSSPKQLKQFLIKQKLLK